MSGHIRIVKTSQAAALQEDKERWLMANRLLNLGCSQEALDRWLDSKPLAYALDLRRRIAQVRAQRSGQTDG